MGILSRFKKDKEEPEKKSLVKKQAVISDENEPTEKTSTKKKAPEKKTTKKEAPVPESKKAFTALSSHVTSVLLRPVVSEKCARLSDEHVLVFDVAASAGRIAVKQAFKELYHVLPVRVNIVNVRGKQVRFGRTMGRQINRKKAYIFVPKNTHIDLFEGV
ncbi:MAG: 50S ribosomal protein L23 [Patescibacteria group bacterium]|jgi:large subunit ribosomal protein L23